MTTYFTADLHLGMPGVIEQCGRPFQSADEMTEWLIGYWNRTVNRNDHVFHIGDLGACGIERMAGYLRRLSGRIYLVPGNHDEKTLGKLSGRSDLLPSHVEVLADVARVNMGRRRLVLCHWPFLSWPGRKPVGRDGAVHLHGHGHGHAYPAPDPLRIDVGWDAHRRFLTWECVVAKVIEAEQAAVGTRG